MSIVLVGLNHHTAPVALRERLSLAGGALEMALDDLNVGRRMAALPGERAPLSAIHEGVILSTCNRLEIYATADDQAGGWAAVEAFLAGRRNIPVAELDPHLYLLEDHEAVDHLMRVASGLDSMILGEPQILGQVAEAFAKAQAAGTAGPALSQLFTRAVHAGKRARSETDISRYTTSISHAAARLAKDTLRDLAAARVLIVGAGEMAELAAAAARGEGAQTMTFINRTYARAEFLAQRFGGRALSWSQLVEALAEADLIISATGAPHTVIYRDDVARTLPLRAGRPLVIVDIAVPRDVEEEVGGLPGVVRYDIDQLQLAVDANRSQREAAVPQVEAIVQQEAEQFFGWLSSRQTVQVLVELRRKTQALAETELEHALRRLASPDPRTEHIVSLLADRLVNKLLHEPTVRLKAEAAAGNGTVYAEALRELFALQPGEDVDRALPDGIGCDG